MGSVPRRVVVAPDSFKGSARAVDVAEALAAGWREVRPDDELVLVPMADGGEGTVDAFAVAFPGARRHLVTVPGPDDRPVEAAWLMLPDATAVVELASASGLSLLDPLRPLTAHTRGFGRAIADALDAGARALLLAIGGSSSTDGGVGALRELGARFVTVSGRELGDGGGALRALAAVDLRGMRPLPPGGARILSDVTSPLLGDVGAARVFGPQKGASPDDVLRLEDGLRHLAAHLDADPEAAGAGAAGGTGFGLLAWGARLSLGSAAVAEALGLAAAVAGADVVVTGEGRFDEQSQAGKVPSSVLALAEAAGAWAYLVAGSLEAPPTGFAVSASLAEAAGSVAAAMAEPLPALRAVGARLALATPSSRVGGRA
ncbi:MULTISPECIES: glycerate kinase [unclassified Rathayibacter]|uniref:glycerate kinase n=1 Tax=unclassified Rathayibacter TaxID=2609250 RepID=UPI00188D1D2B|nr:MULTISPECIES: glycerate kinase [unclassified Rathayibacter]MBF4462933.1 glycerate kinase [Rathayibacter sp. VKM Ac-2879]MBF4504347.1 glycerate kinase [Rathayibacter sp. VKM Ac-2878]